MSYSLEIGAYTACFLVGLYFVASVFLGFSFQNVVHIEDLPEFKEAKFLELQEKVKSQELEIEKLKLIQPVDYNGAIFFVGFGFLVVVFLSMFYYFEHKEKLAKLIIESKKVKK